MAASGMDRIKQVLYVEDSSTSQLIMRKYIETMGLGELTIAPTPGAAIHLLDDTSFDLIITDYLFPSGDALELIRHIRRAPAHQLVPIIVISGSMDEALLSRVVKAGANDGLAKPLDASVVCNMVRCMLQAPYVRKLERSISTVSCFQWFDGQIYHEFCPELNLTLSDADIDPLKNRMMKALQEKSAQGHLMGYTNNERVVSYLIRD
jgi:two-component system phosphate regulon response regulator PhoB